MLLLLMLCLVGMTLHFISHNPHPSSINGSSKEKQKTAIFFMFSFTTRHAVYISLLLSYLITSDTLYFRLHLPLYMSLHFQRRVFVATGTMVFMSMLGWVFDMFQVFCLLLWNRTEACS